MIISIVLPVLVYLVKTQISSPFYFNKQQVRNPKLLLRSTGNDDDNVIPPPPIGLRGEWDDWENDSYIGTLEELSTLDSSFIIPGVSTDKPSSSAPASIDQWDDWSEEPPYFDDADSQDDDVDNNFKFIRSSPKSSSSQSAYSAPVSFFDGADSGNNSAGRWRGNGRSSFIPAIPVPVPVPIPTSTVTATATAAAVTIPAPPPSNSLPLSAATVVSSWSGGAESPLLHEINRLFSESEKRLEKTIVVQRELQSAENRELRATVQFTKELLLASLILNVLLALWNHV